jgi:hypothetical protein
MEKSPDAEFSARKVRRKEQVVPVAYQPKREIVAFEVLKEFFVISPCGPERYSPKKNGAFAEKISEKIAILSLLYREWVPPMFWKGHIWVLDSADLESQECHFRESLKYGDGLADNGFIWQNNVVVQRKNVRSSCSVEALIASCCRRIVFATDQASPFSELRFDHVRRSVGRSIIHDDDLKLRPIELQGAGDTRSQEILVIVIKDYDGDEGVLTGGQDKFPL